MQDVVVLLLLAFPPAGLGLDLGEAVKAPVQKLRLGVANSNDPGQRVSLQKVPGGQFGRLPVASGPGTRVRSGPATLGRVRRPGAGLGAEMGMRVVRVVATQDRAPLRLRPLLLEHEVRRVEAREGVRVPEERVVGRLRREGTP